MGALQGYFFWGFLIAFGIAMYLVVPRSKDEAGFFTGHDDQGRPASEWALMMSIFISWIFAKSVTNAANLGATYGVVGGLAYAAYWLSIPVAGLVIYRLRTREGATGLVPFLIHKYGRGAALAFSLAILVRLFNEVWSNTAVVGGYYGASGSAGFIGAALLFTAAMLRAFVVAGVLGFVAIFAFSLVGVHARLEGLAASGNVPAEVARGLGVAGYFAMIVVMVTSAGSTLDSTFTSLSKLVARELPLLAGRLPSPKAMTVGALTMVAFALLGNLPMIAGTDILKATTISGTMVIGLAPIFMFSGRVGHSPLSFHLAFWPGIALGVLLAVNGLPAAWAIGSGKYAVLLGTNLYGLLLCTAGFFLPLVAPRFRAGVSLGRSGTAA